MEKKKKEKKKWKKKEEVPSTAIELANFDFIVWWFPLRHSGINCEITFNKPTRCSLVPYTKTKTIFPTLKPRLAVHTQTSTHTVSFFFLACSNSKLASLELLILIYTLYNYRWQLQLVVVTVVSLKRSLRLSPHLCSSLNKLVAPVV